MIVAHLPIPRGLVIPERILQASRTPQIDVSTQSVPMGAAEWIACCQATPHDDTHMGDNDLLYVTLAVRARHSLGDARSIDPAIHLQRGDLFVVDPKVVHWLFAADAWQSMRKRPFVGLQWKVSKRKAREQIEKIVRAHRGRWITNTDPRYRNWEAAA